MAWFDDEEEKKEGLSPDQKELVYKSVLEKYKATAGDDSEIKKAEGKAKWKDAGFNILESVSEFVAPNAGESKTWDRLRGENKARVDQAKKSRLDKMEGVLKEDQLERMGTDRAFQDKERGRKEKDWANSDELKAREDDPASEESRIAQDLAKKMMPGRDFSKMSATQLKSALPSIEKLYGIEQNAKWRDTQKGWQNRKPYEYTDENGNKRLGTVSPDGLEKSSDDPITTPFKPTNEQSNKAGLVDFGNKANQQFEDAISKGKKEGNYDPTDPWEFIDNSTTMAPNWMKSDAAVESQAAQSAWVENYLRDASGAAIPVPERLNYAKDFFPRPGDTPQTLKNKEELRKQKEEEAKIVAGPALKNRPKQLSDTVTIKAPDGSVKTVKRSAAQKYIDKGGVIVNE